jgi:hypothetical protein
MFAAEFLNCILSSRNHAYSKAGLICYYWIMREIYTADAPDWRIGGARAGPKGRVSAFITATCVDVILRFVEAHENTSEYISNLYLINKQLKILDNCALPAAWKDAEKNRLRHQCYIKLYRLHRLLMLPFKRPSSPTSLEEELSITDISKFVADVSLLVSERTDAFASAYIEINKFWEFEKKYLENYCGKDNEEVKRFERAEFAHNRVMKALGEGLERAKAIQALLKADSPLDKKVEG